VAARGPRSYLFWVGTCCQCTHTYPCAQSCPISARVRVILTGAAQGIASASPILPHCAAAAHPNTSARICPPKPSNARSNHLGRLDPHHLPALAWSPFLFLCAVTVACRRSCVVAMATPPPYWLTAVAWMSARARTCRTHTRNHARTCLERSRPSLLLPFAPDLAGTPSRYGTRLCRRGKSFLPGSASADSTPFSRTRLAHARANPVVSLHTSSETEAPSSRPPRRSTSPCRRGRPSAWAHERQAKSVHMFVHTHARRRTPRRATAELAAMAKPPTCLRAQVRTWTPPLAG
jgi:hypothetical protein